MPAALLPADIDLSVLPHSERALIEALRDDLDQDWTLVPRVVVTTAGKDGEIDLVAVSRTRGAILFEVKGGSITMQGGRFVQNGHVLDKSPVDQLVAAKHALIRRMRQMGVPLEGLFLHHAVCFPDVEAAPDAGFGPGCPASMVFSARSLQWPRQAVFALADRPHAPIAEAAVARFLAALCPDVVQGFASSSAYLDATEEQMGRATRDMLAIARGADVNRRVLLTGGPGSGKTAVVRAWVDQAVARGERVAAMCFNKPVSSWIASRATQAAYVGTFHELLAQLAASWGHAVPNDPSPSYFRDELPALVRARLHDVARRFDTIIVDEGQDFLPHWLSLLESLLDPSAPRRLLVAADPGQAINVDEWVPPDEMMRLHSPVNLRNARAIASFARRFGGGEPYLHNAIGAKPGFIVAGGHKERVKAVRAALTAALDEHGIPAGRLLVVGIDRDTTRELREITIERAGAEPIRLVPWEDRDEGSIVCESVRRAKGLEATAVVFVCRDAETDPRRLGVGITRARLRLTVVGPRPLGEALGMVPAARSGDEARLH